MLSLTDDDFKILKLVTINDLGECMKQTSQNDFRIPRIKPEAVASQFECDHDLDIAKELAFQFIKTNEEGFSLDEVLDWLAKGAKPEPCRDLRVIYCVARALARNESVRHTFNVYLPHRVYADSIPSLAYFHYNPENTKGIVSDVEIVPEPKDFDKDSWFIGAKIQ